VKLVGYRPEHAISFTALLAEKGRRDHPDFSTWATARGGDHPAVTLIDDHGEPVVCAGIMHLWESVGQVWMIASIDAKAIAKTLTVYSRRILDGWWDHFGYRRLQATVDADTEVSRRFAEHMGFRPEGTLRRYGPGDVDQIMYARVRDE